jgi:hypothetical protein
MSKLFKEEKKYTSLEKLKAQAVNDKFQCDCAKDPNLTFGCKNGVKWFVEHIVMSKVKKKLRISKDFAKKTNDLSFDENKEIVRIVKDQYVRCKKQYKKLLEIIPPE